MAMVILSMVGSLVFFFTIGKGLNNSSVFNKLVLNTTMEPGSGQVGPEFKVIKTGMVGMTVTMLKPAGKVLIENEIFTGKAENGFIEQGKKVMVINQDGMGVLVREIHDEPA